MLLRVSLDCTACIQQGLYVAVVLVVLIFAFDALRVLSFHDFRMLYNMFCVIRRMRLFITNNIYFQTIVLCATKVFCADTCMISVCAAHRGERLGVIRTLFVFS
jgi:hypothetical protein